MKARLIAVPLLLVGGGAVAHVISVVRGVHFKTEAIDFGQPPLRRGFQFDDGTGSGDPWRPGTKYRYAYWEVQEAKEIKDAADLKRLTAQARADERAGRIAAARAAYRSLQSRGLGDPNLLASRLELLGTPGIAGAKGLQPYLRGFFPTDVAPVLRPWVRYAKARTVGDYLRVARDYPTSSRAPAALIMAARLASNGSKPRDVPSARRAASTILFRYPKSRFVWDARGVLGRVAYLKGDSKGALAQYETQVRTADSPVRKANAYESILVLAKGDRPRVAFTELRWAVDVDSADPYVARGLLYRTLGRFRAGDAPRFYGLLAGEPRLYAAYLEYRASLDERASDVLALARPAQRATQGTPYRAKVDATLARVALARNDAHARTFAQGAARGTGMDAALGNFVLATLDRRAGKTAEARKAYLKVAASGTYLAGGARENVAILSERLGDFQTALDSYLALGYGDDVAYLADARMTPAQLSVAVRRHPERDELRYTLAMRHLRKGDWDAAEVTLKPFSDARRKRLTVIGAPYYADGGLQDPLATVRALRELDARVKTAEGDEAKADALFAMADYYYRHKTLLLYSAPAWRGGRAYDFAFSWNPAVATSADDSALRVHHDEHECYAQALRRYKQVVDDYPKAKIAPRAAYWAAVAAEHLSNMAPYWRWREVRDDRQGEAVKLLLFAERADDPVLAAKAKKYGKVFADERTETRKAFANEPFRYRQWNPDAE